MIPRIKNNTEKILMLLLKNLSGKNSLKFRTNIIMKNTSKKSITHVIDG